MPLIESALKKSGKTYQDIKAVAATIGPGSFTSIRVGVAAAKGIALALSIPFIGITSLEALAWGAHLKGHKLPVLAAINAHRGELYGQRFRTSRLVMEPLNEASAAAPAAFHNQLGSADYCIAGNARELLEPVLTDMAKHITFLDEVVYPDALFVASLAEQYMEHGTIPAAQLPVYIRAPDAKIPGNPLL